MKARADPMHLVELMNGAPRCSAMSKRSRCRCRAPAVKGRNVCRMHGARAGAPSGRTNGAWRHGRETNEAVARRRGLRELISASRELVRQIGES